MKEVTRLKHSQTLLAARGRQLTVGDLLKKLWSVDQSMPVSISGDGFNLVELDDNSVMILDHRNGPSCLVIGLHTDVKRSAA